VRVGKPQAGTIRPWTPPGERQHRNVLGDATERKKATILLEHVRERGVDKQPDFLLFVNARGEPLTRFGVRHILRKRLDAAKPACGSITGKRVSPHTVRHYLPFRTMSSSCSVAFLFGRFARNSGDIDIGLLSSAWGERADVELIIDNEAVLSRSGQKAHLRGSCNHNVTGRAADR
jgi:hypothetical protein